MKKLLLLTTLLLTAVSGAWAVTSSGGSFTVDGKTFSYVSNPGNGYSELNLSCNSANVLPSGDWLTSSSSDLRIGIYAQISGLGANVFKDKTNITSITLGNTVATIGESACEGCTGLTSITIPASVTSIGANAFKGCTSLETVTFEGNQSTITIASNAFEGTPYAAASIKSIEDSWISYNNNFTYNGSEQSPTITVNDGTKNLIKDTDYEITGTTKGTNVNTYTFTVTGKNTYKGSVEKTFTINHANMSNVSITDVTSYIDLGETITQNPTVKLGEGYTLTSSDYDVELLNTDAVGTATIRLTGKGNFTGTNETATFDVTRKVELNTSYNYLTYYAAEDLESPEGYTVETIADASLEAGTLTPSAALSYIPKETAVVLKKTGTAQGTYHLKATTGTAPAVFSGFKGVLAATAVGSLEGTVQYILVGSEFVKLEQNDGDQLPANRCYLAFSANAGARTLRIVENTTAIDGIEASEKGGWYTLDGRKLSGKPAKKGIYVKDGNKVIIK